MQDHRQFLLLERLERALLVHQGGTERLADQGGELVLLGEVLEYLVQEGVVDRTIRYIVIVLLLTFLELFHGLEQRLTKQRVVESGAEEEHVFSEVGLQRVF